MSYVQSAVGSTNGATSLAVTLSGVTTGDAIFVGIVTSGSSTTISTVSDGTNSYSRVSGRNFLAGAGGTEIWAAYNVTGGNLTVTVTASASVQIGVVLDEWSSVVTSSAFDVQSTSTGTSTALNSGSATTNQASEAIVGMFSTAGTGLTAGTGYTMRKTGTTTSYQFGLEDEQVSSAGSYSAAATINSSQTWTACMATFKLTASGSLVPTLPRVRIFTRRVQL